MWLNSTGSAYTGNAQAGNVGHTMQSTSAYLNHRTAQGVENRFSDNEQYGYSQRTAGSFGAASGYGMLQPVGTGSFVAINEQMAYGVTSWEEVEQGSGLMRSKRPHDAANGQLVPVGDVVVPLLVYAALFAMAKAVKKIMNWKKTL